MSVRSDQAAAVLATIPKDALSKVAAQFPPAEEIGIREDREYFREVIYVGPDVPKNPVELERWLKADLSARQKGLIEGVRHYSALLHGDVSVIDDKTLISRFKNNPENGMHVSLVMARNGLSFERTMISVLMDELAKLEEERNG